MPNYLRTNYRKTGNYPTPSTANASAFQLSALDLHIVYGSFASTFNQSSLWKQSTNGYGRPVILGIHVMSIPVSTQVLVGLCAVSGSIMIFHGYTPRVSGTAVRKGFSATSTDTDDMTHFLWSALIVSR